MQINHLPAEDKTNGWSGILGHRTPKPALSDDISADWVVVGAGYAGLGAARRLAEIHPKDQIVLIDAGEIGENASGRNSGFAIDLPHNVGSSLDELESSYSYMRLARAAIAHLEERVKTDKIDCHWTRNGKYHAAVSARGVRAVLEPFANELDSLNEPYAWIDKHDLPEKLGTEHFTAAVYTPGNVLMNPAALTRGLADSLPANVALFENSPVIKVDCKNAVQLTTPSGSIRATRMILTANGFADQFGFYKRNLLQLVAHASLTRQLTAAEQHTCGINEAWGLTPANAFAGITMRYTNDHRILIRHGIEYCPARKFPQSKLQQVKARHKRLFDQRFPMLRNIEMEHTWSGFVCLSRNSAPGFGQLASNIWSAVCQNAIGVAKGTIGGILAADMASEIENPLIGDMQNLGKPTRLPPRPFLDIGMRARFNWELWTNLHEA